MVKTGIRRGITRIPLCVPVIFFMNLTGKFAPLAVKILPPGTQRTREDRNGRMLMNNIVPLAKNLAHFAVKTKPQKARPICTKTNLPQSTANLTKPLRSSR